MLGHTHRRGLASIQSRLPRGRHALLIAGLGLATLACGPTYAAEAKPAEAKPAKKAEAKAPDAKPLFASKLIDTTTPGQAVAIDVDIAGAPMLALVVTDGGNGFGSDWADWAEPRLIDAAGKETKLTELKWRSASSEWGKVYVNSNANGQPLKIANESVAYGIGTHASSVIIYDLPKGHGYTRFKARGGLDKGGADQGGASVEFMVFAAEPPRAVLGKGKPAGSGGKDAPESLVALDVHADLQAEVFASEPMLLSPSNIDIDAQGRVWVCEVVNYRGHKGKRPEGDRVLIIQDKDGDGKADDVKTFYQAADFNSPHGVTVLATPDGKGTVAIAAVGDKVLTLTDTDGDDKADKVDVLFSGISGNQHDHGIHQFIFGPDGKLYFNFGNSGNQIKDKAGKIIVDKEGNEVKVHGKPYRQGMIFRCNLDGSEFETLAWNFRNNWMVTVDSFGGLWQSDNDDDGNRGVRINYVVEFGNYGYTQEFTGAGWGDGWKKAQAKGAKEDLRPLYHWHQFDPGVMPNLINTGAGSPTGICVYEANLLPKVFQNQVLHCDAGPNVVRAYPAVKAGAGYTAEMLPILTGARDKWFRPSDVKVAPDGSLIVADWYDPGVGGHGMGDLGRGRLFRVTPKGHTGYKVPKVDVSTVKGALEALNNPTPSARYLGWQALHGMGKAAEPALQAAWADKASDSRTRARALWLLGKSADAAVAAAAIESALADADPDLRVTGIRLLRQAAPKMLGSAFDKLSSDKAPEVRRELAVAIRHDKSEGMPGQWAKLAAQHDGVDRWYLETLGLSADGRWDDCLAAYLKLVADPTATAAGRDLVWRSRAKATPALLAKIIKSGADKANEAKYMKAFDFQTGKEKDEALKSLLDL